MLDSDLIGKIVSFDTYAQYLLGTSYKRCKVLGILDVDSARHLADVEAISVAIYPALPTGTPKDYRNYQYLKVRLTNGTDTVVATKWIKENTLVVHNDVAIQVNIRGINPSDINKIRGILQAYNYTDFSIEQL